MRRPGPRVPSTLDPYLEYLQQRWNEGEHNAKLLHQELQAKGFLGHYQRVKMAIARLRRGLPVDQPHTHPPSPRDVARWITASPPRRTLDTVERLRRLLAHCPELDRTHSEYRDINQGDTDLARIPVTYCPAQVPGRQRRHQEADAGPGRSQRYRRGGQRLGH